MSQHAGLDAERWCRFDVDRQVLMIGNEMNRATRFAAVGNVEAVRKGYERILRLVDLTVACGPRRALLREILRWRDLIAALYAAPFTDEAAHRTAFRALLHLRPTAARQIPLLLPERS